MNYLFFFVFLKALKMNGTRVDNAPCHVSRQRRRRLFTHVAAPLTSMRRCLRDPTASSLHPWKPVFPARARHRRRKCALRRFCHVTIFSPTSSTASRAIRNRRAGETSNVNCYRTTQYGFFLRRGAALYYSNFVSVDSILSSPPTSDWGKKNHRNLDRVPGTL